MNNRLRFTSPRALSFVFAALFFASSATAFGDDPAPQDLRFHEAILLADHLEPLTVDVFRSKEKRRAFWNLRVASSRNSVDPICLSTFPSEAGDDFYRFRIHQLDGPDDQLLILLESYPDEGARRLDPPVYQVAFHLEPHRGASGWRCTVVARGEFTELDGGSSLFLNDSLPPQLLRHNAAAGVRFCGIRHDEDADQEYFDFNTGRFQPASRQQISTDGALELSPTPVDAPLSPPLTDGFYSWVAATSDLRGAPGGSSVARPLALGDLDLSTAWIAGLQTGENPDFVTAAISDAAELRGLRIFPGHGASPEQFLAHNRPSRVLISLSDGQRFLVNLPDISYDEAHQSQGIYIELPQPIRTRCITVMLLDERATHRDRSVAIAEITPYSVLDAESDEDTARRIVVALANESDRRRRDQIADLARLIPGPMIDAISTTLNGANEIRRERVLPLLGQLPHERALPLLHEHYLRIPVDAQDYSVTKRTIAAHGELAAPTLLAILDGLSDEEPRKFIDTVRLIGRVGTELHLLRLIEDLGEGDEILRQERIRAIAAGAISVVPRLITVAVAEGDSPAGLDALTAIVFVGQRHFRDTPADLDHVDTLWQIYDESQRRAHRIRAIEALGYFLHPDGASLINQEILSRNPDPILRSYAARALRLYPGSTPRQALQNALFDESPDVRIAAIKALADRDDFAKATDAVIDYIDSERWPQGLHHGVHLLAASPQPGAIEALSQFIEQDLTTSSSASALRALRRNERSLAIDEIEKYLMTPSTPHRIRRQLVDMLTHSDSDQAQPMLFTIATGDPNNRYLPPLDADSVDSLQRRALLVIGARGGGLAMDHLITVVADPNRPLSHRESALRGLAFLSSPDVVEHLQDLATSIPVDLRRLLSQTIGIVRNRLAIDEADREIDVLLESLDEDSSGDTRELP